MSEKTISKVMSPNDVGSTKSHQAGMLIPKDRRILDFFPVLDATYNPRQSIVFEDPGGQKWKFNFIHYNNKLHGKGTRNEYRLTGMTKFIRQAALKSGDSISFVREDTDYRVRIDRVHAESKFKSPNRLVMSAGWVVINKE
jgi:hypothetical protein